MSSKKRTISKIEKLLSLEGLRALKTLKSRSPLNSRIGNSTSSKHKPINQGLQFSELIEYQSGNDSRLIDWKSSARSTKVLVKKFEPELHRSRCVILDCSESVIASTTFKILGSSVQEDKKKFSLKLFLQWILGYKSINLDLIQNKDLHIEIYEAVCMLALHTLINDDHLHLILFNSSRDVIHINSNSRNGWSKIADHLTRICSLYKQGVSNKSINNLQVNKTELLGESLQLLTKYVKNRSQVFLCSDFDFNISNIHSKFLMGYELKVIYQGLKEIEAEDHCLYKKIYRSNVKFTDSNFIDYQQLLIDSESLDSEIHLSEEEKINSLITIMKLPSSHFLDVSNTNLYTSLPKIVA